MLTRFRNIAYVMAYTVATIPLWHYIRDGRILALMVAVVTFAYVNVALSTVEAAHPILSSEKAKTPLPRWLPDKPKYQKWWLLVRRTLKWHLLLIPPKMGLALGFVQFFFTSTAADFGGFLNSYSYGYFRLDHYTCYPQWETLLMGFLFILTFTIFNGSLLCSMTISSDGKIYKVIVLMIVFTLVAYGMVELAKSGIYLLWGRPYDTPYFQRYHLIEETLHTATNTVFEQSLLVSANIMRPNSGGWDNRLFVARQIVAGLLGLLLYAGATWLVLWFVEDENHAD